MNQTNASRLFLASCIALITTSMTFAIRAGMVGKLGTEFQLDNTQLGMIVGMAALGFPIATTLGGFFVDQVGMKRWMWLAFGAHVIGLLMTIFASGFWTLYLSTFLIGFANGSVEAVCNPLIASMYPDKKIAMLNKFHVWFPGGIVIGALLGASMSHFNISWHWQVATILIPTVLYAYLFFGQSFPKTERVTSGVSYAEMFSAVLSPLFIFMAICMFLTANTELSTTQWIDKLIKGGNALLILALVNGLMAIGRYSAGSWVHRFKPVNVLLMSSVFAILGLYMLRTFEGNMLYVAAIVFAIGVCFFWPTMLGFVSETMPKTGALGLSLMGGAGMLGNWAYQSFFIGPKLDALKAASVNEVDAGRMVLADINILPVILVVAFAALYLMKGKLWDKEVIA